MVDETCSVCRKVTSSELISSYSEWPAQDTQEKCTHTGCAAVTAAPGQIQPRAASTSQITSRGMTVIEAAVAAATGVTAARGGAERARGPAPGTLHALEQLPKVDGVLASAPRQQRRLVHNVGQLRPRKACAAAVLTSPARGHPPPPPPPPPRVWLISICTSLLLSKWNVGAFE